MQCNQHHESTIMFIPGKESIKMGQKVCLEIQIKVIKQISKRKEHKYVNLAGDSNCQAGDKEPIQVSQKVSFQRQNGRVVPDNI